MVNFKDVLGNTDGVDFPNTLTVNATGAGTGDGTEMVKILFDQIFGLCYSLMDSAGLTPDSLTEAPGTSQIVESVQRIAGGPGEGVIWWKNADPATTGDRVLLLKGQVILISDYQDLVSATYKGDGTNGTVPSYYKTSDAGGTTRDTGGTYYVLPDTRGYFLRGLDVAAAVDPDGASRIIGTVQNHAFQGHNMRLGRTDVTGSYQTVNDGQIYMDGSGGGAFYGVAEQTNRIGTFRMLAHTPEDDGTNGIPKISSETRPENISVEYGIRY